MRGRVALTGIPFLLGSPYGPAEGGPKNVKLKSSFPLVASLGLGKRTSSQKSKPPPQEASVDGPLPGGQEGVRGTRGVVWSVLCARRARRSACAVWEGGARTFPRIFRNLCFAGPRVNSEETCCALTARAALCSFL